MRRCTCQGTRCRLADDDRRHGTENGYKNLWCRCEKCRRAFADAHWLYMAVHPGQARKAMLRERKRRGDDGLDERRRDNRSVPRRTDPALEVSHKKGAK